MVNILQSLSRTVHYSILLAIILFLGLYFAGDGFVFDQYFFSWLFRFIHVLVGGMRASIYNAMPFDGVKDLIQFMDDFESKYG